MTSNNNNNNKRGAQPLRNVIAQHASNSPFKLPEKLPCHECRASKPRVAFAKNRIDDVKFTGLTPTSRQNLVCIQCSPVSVTELFCIHCNKRKGKDSFSKVQRRTPDHALCRVCVYKYNEALPGHMAEDSDAGSDEDDVNFDDHKPTGQDKTITRTCTTTTVTTTAASSTSRFPKVKAPPRKVERPQDEDDDVEVAKSDDEGDWVM